MAEFLRPETLFGAKFDGYLNASDPPEPSRVRGNYGVDMTREGWGHVIGDDDTEAAA